VDFVRRGAEEASLPPERAGELELVIEELFVNICHHAYPESHPGAVAVSYCIPSPGELNLELADQGVEFNPLQSADPDINVELQLRPIGGLGIFLVKRLAKSLAYSREDGWNRLRFGISSGS
jgi:serine/threonine-protein kinase RsbW